MKIGLVRHFKVDIAYPEKGLLNKAEIEAWFAAYASADVQYGSIDLGGVEWKKCFSSSMLRAYHTAKHIYKGEVIKVDVLQELDAMPLLKTSIRWPFILWAIFVRMKFSSSDKVVVAFKKNIQLFVEEMLSKNNHDVLIVSHGFVMMCIQKELMSRGFRGKTFGAPANGKLYVFEKQDIRVCGNPTLLID
jgi:broad specificity phosphatase PhoE